MDNTMEIHEHDTLHIHADTDDISGDPPSQVNDIPSTTSTLIEEKKPPREQTEEIMELAQYRTTLEEKEILIGRLSGTIKRMKKEQMSKHQEQSTLMALQLLNVPAKVRKLLQELHPRPVTHNSGSIVRNHHVVNVASIQRQWEEFIVWRQRIINEITSVSRKNRLHDKLATACGRTHYLDDLSEDPVDLITTHFETVDTLGSALRDFIWHTVRHCADAEPQVVEQSMSIVFQNPNVLDIVDSNGKDNNHQTLTVEEKQIIRSSMFRLHCMDHECNLIQYESLKERCYVEIQHTIRDQTRACIQDLLSREKRKHESVNDRRLLQQLYLVLETIATYFPDPDFLENFPTVEIVSQVIEQTLLLIESGPDDNDPPQQIPPLAESKNPFVQSSVDMKNDNNYSNLSQDIVRQIKIGHWCDVMKKDAVTFNMLGLVPTIDLVDAEFTQRYLAGIQSQVQEATEQLVRRSYDPIVDSPDDNSTFVTTEAVETLMTYVLEQVVFLSRYCRSSRLRQAIVVCLELLQVRQQVNEDDMMAIQLSNLECLPEGYLQHVAATLNEHDEMQSSMSRISDLASDALGSVETKVLEATLTTLAIGSEHVIALATQSAVSIIFRDVTDVVNLELFTSRWLLLDEGRAIRTILATFEDYFADLRLWIRREHYVQALVLATVNALVVKYLERLINSPNDDIVFRPEEIQTKVCVAMETDLRFIREYVSGKAAADPGLLKSNKSELLTHVIAFMAADNPSHTFDEIARCIGKRDSGVVLRKLVHVRSDLKLHASLDVRRNIDQEIRDWDMWGKSANHIVVDERETISFKIVDTHPPSLVEIPKKVKRRTRPSVRLTSGTKTAKAMFGKGLKKAKEKKSSMMTLSLRKKSRSTTKQTTRPVVSEVDQQPTLEDMNERARRS